MNLATERADYATETYVVEDISYNCVSRFTIVAHDFELSMQIITILACWSTGLYSWVLRERVTDGMVLNAYWS